MKFTTLKASSPNKAQRELNAGLTRRLKFSDQFNCFDTEITAEASEEVMIPNYLRDVGGNSKIPSEWAVIDARGAAMGSLMRGATEWTKDKLYVTNMAATTGTFTIRFFE